MCLGIDHNDYIKGINPAHPFPASNQIPFSFHIKSRPSFLSSLSGFFQDSFQDSWMMLKIISKYDNEADEIPGINETGRVDGKAARGLICIWG